MACVVPLMSFTGNLMGVTTQAAFVQSMIVLFVGGRTGLSAVVTGALRSKQPRDLVPSPAAIASH